MLLLLQKNLGFAWGAVALVVVPDVVGQTQAAGTATLQGSGFVVSVVTAYSSTVPAGTIISQSPIGGSSASGGSTVTITVSLGEAPRSQPAGRKHKKHRYYVEIDGQVFHAEDVQHAMAILDHAADLAYKAATKEADAIGSKIKRARRIGLATPKITSDAPIDLKPYRTRIRTAYKNAAVDAELRIHMAMLLAEDDEAAAMLLL